MLLLLAIILLILAVGLGGFVKSIFWLIAILAVLVLAGYVAGRSRA